MVGVHSTCEATRILVADHHTLFCECVSSLLRSQPHLEVVAEVRTAVAMVQQARDTLPDIVITNVMMDGIDGTQMLCHELPNTRVIALSEHIHAPLVSAMLRAGASAFVAKDHGLKELLHVVSAVLEGQTYLCPRVRQVIVDEHIHTCKSMGDSAAKALTLKEQNILRLIGDGKTAKEIGLALHMSAKTVDAHRRRLMDDLELASMADIVKYAIRHHLTTV